jgi:hypothetical protein
MTTKGWLITSDLSKNAVKSAFYVHLNLYNHVAVTSYILGFILESKMGGALKDDKWVKRAVYSLFF